MGAYEIINKIAITATDNDPSSQEQHKYPTPVFLISIGYYVIRLISVNLMFKHRIYTGPGKPSMSAVSTADIHR